MDARTNIKDGVPSCRGTEGLARAPRLSCPDANDAALHAQATADQSAIKFDATQKQIFKKNQIFKKTWDSADSEQVGRDVAKDSLEVSGMPLPITDNGDAHRENTGIGAGVGIANVKLTDGGLTKFETKRPPRETNDQSGALRENAQRIGPAVDGAVTHPVVRTRNSVMRTRSIIVALMLGAAPVAGPGFAFDGAPVNPKDAALPVVSQPAAQALNAQALGGGLGGPLGGGLGASGLKKAVPSATAAAASTTTSLTSLQYAAEDGHPVAQWRLGRMYAAGDGVTQDDLRAFEYFSRIANAHAEDSPSAPQAAIVANAFVALGRYYLDGIPNSKVKADKERAREMFSYAASYFGNADAQYDLARLYLKTPDASREDFRYGARWLGLAAQKGQHQAQALLGQMLFNGDRLPPQRARGLMWLTLARDSAAADEAWIKESYNRAITKASEDDRAMALQMLEHWVQGRKD
jgi:exopolysaccharide production negative regulator